MFLQIPTFEDPYYEMPISIRGIPYVLNFYFNEREDTWYLDFLDVNRDPIVQGIKCMPGPDLIKPYSYNEKLPKIRLYVSVPKIDDRPPGRLDFGTDKRAYLIYEVL